MLAGPPAVAQTAQFSGAVTTILSTGLNTPYGEAVDANGNIFVADTFNNAVKEILASSGYTTVKTLGSGFAWPVGVAVDGNGNVFVGDQHNNAVEEILAAGGYTTVNPLASGFNNPMGVALDGNGNLFVADNGNGAVKEILAAGGYTTVNTLAAMSGPCGVAVDGKGNVYVAGPNKTAIVEIEAVNGSIPDSPTIVALGSGLNSPHGVAVDGSGNLFVADNNNNAVKEIVAAGGYTTVNTLGGGFDSPFGLAVDGYGNVFVSDSWNNAVKEILTAGANFGTVAIATGVPPTLPLFFSFATGGSIGAPAVLTQGASGLDFTDAGTGTCDTNGTNFVYKIDDSCSIVVKFAPTLYGPRYGSAALKDGSGNVIATGYLQGMGSAAQLNFLPATQTWIGPGPMAEPAGVAVDESGNVYVADTQNNRVLKETLSAGSYMQTVVPTSTLYQPAAVAVDGSGNIYIADTQNSRVLKEVPSASGYTESTIGSGLNITMGVAVDGSGNVYICDYDNQRVLKENPSGSGYTQSTIVDATSGINSCHGMAVDSAGNVYIADSGVSKVWKETLGAGGSYTLSNIGSGFYNPMDVAVDGNGSVYVADFGNHQVLKETPSAGGYTQSIVVDRWTAEDNGSDFIRLPMGVAVDWVGNVYVVDAWAAQVLKVDYADPPSGAYEYTTIVDTTDTQDGPLQFTVLNIGNLPLTFHGIATSSASFTIDSGTTTCAQSSPLAAGASCIVGVDFTPIVTGHVTGTLNLTDNEFNAGAPTYSTQSFALSGYASPPPLINPTVTVTPSSSTISEVQALKVTVTVSGGTGKPAPTGTIKLSSGSYASLPTNLVSGVATITVPGGSLAVGTDSLAARYAPDTASSSVYTGAEGWNAVKVYALTTPTVALTSTATAGTISYKDSITFTATVTASGAKPTGKVNFLDGTEQIGSGNLNSGGVGTYSTTTLIAGKHSITASYAGDTNYTPATSNAVSITVKQIVPSVNWAAPAAITYGTALGLAQLDATASVPGKFVYTPAAGYVPGAGSQKLTANFTPADAVDYASVPASVTLKVNKAVLIVTATSISLPYNQPIPKLTYSLGGLVNGDPSSVVTGAAAESTTAKRGSPAGAYPITITQGTLKAANYSFDCVNGTLTITSSGTTAAPTVTTSAATGIGSAGATFNGTVTANNATTRYWFTYGTSESSLSSSTAKAGSLKGTTTTVVHATVTGLKPKTIYYFQAHASNSVGTRSGAVLSFQTN